MGLHFAYSWLSLLRGLGMIIILLPDIWYSWTPVLLNSCILEPLKQGDSWYYTPDDPRNWLTMDIGLLWTHCGQSIMKCSTYTGTGETDEYWYSLHVYDGLIVSRDHILGFYLEATRSFRGVYWHPYSPACRVCHKPLGLFPGSGDILFMFGRTISPGT